MKSITYTEKMINNMEDHITYHVSEKGQGDLIRVQKKDITDCWRWAYYIPLQDFRKCNTSIYESCMRYVDLVCKEDKIEDFFVAVHNNRYMLVWK